MDPKATLQQWIANHDLKAASFARRVEYDRGNFHRILHGRAWPSLELALRIERETAGAVPMASWAQAKEAA